MLCYGEMENINESLDSRHRPIPTSALGDYLFFLRQEFSNGSKDFICKRRSFQMAHMSSIWKCDPSYAGYVVKKWHCSYILRGIKLAVIHKRRRGNLI